MLEEGHIHFSIYDKVSHSYIFNVLWYKFCYFFVTGAIGFHLYIL